MPAQKKCPHVTSGIVMDGGSRGQIKASLVQRHKLEVKKNQYSTKDLHGAFEAKVKTLDEAGLSRFLMEVTLLESAYNIYSSRTSDRLQAAAKRHRVNSEKIAEEAADEFAAKRKKQEQKRKGIRGTVTNGKVAKARNPA